MNTEELQMFRKIETTVSFFSPTCSNLFQRTGGKNQLQYILGLRFTSTKKCNLFYEEQKTQELNQNQTWLDK